MFIYGKNDKYIEALLEDENYQVHSDGTILRLVGDFWVPVRQINRQGYLCIVYQTKRLQLHRIIYAKFVGPLNGRLVTNHKDGNTLNNHPENLELITQQENNAHKYKVLKHAPVLGNRKLTDEQVIELRQLRKVGWSVKALCDRYGLKSRSNVWSITSYQTYKHLP
jgi:hypothetical protein